MMKIKTILENNNSLKGYKNMNSKKRLLWQ